MMPATPTAHSFAKGAFLVTAAFFFAAVYSAFCKAATGVPSLQVVFFQYGISLLIFIPLVLKDGVNGLKSKRMGLMCFRSLAGSICQLLFIISVTRIPLLDSVLLSNAAPLFIPFVIWYWLRRTVQPIVWVCLIIGLLGICLIIRPGPDLLTNPASLIALLAAVFSAIALVATNRLSDTENTFTILFYNFAVSTVLLFFLCIFTWKAINLHETFLLVGAGVFYALTQYLLVVAYKYATAAEISPFNYSVVVFSGLLGWIFFGNVPDGMDLLGTMLVCAGGILCIKLGHHHDTISDEPVRG
jgi:drug/metabolite transporter (DMT)-like permease